MSATSCPICQHPSRMHGEAGCLAGGGRCGCSLSPRLIELVQRYWQTGSIGPTPAQQLARDARGSGCLA